MIPAPADATSPAKIPKPKSERETHQEDGAEEESCLSEIPGCERQAAKELQLHPCDGCNSKAGCKGKKEGKHPPKSRERRILLRKLNRVIKKRKLKPIPPPPKIRPELRRLGQLLNFDPILSGDRDIACATCHHPATRTADARHLPLGTGGQLLGRARFGGKIVPRNSPSLFNLHLYESVFWDNRIEPGDTQISTPADRWLTQDMRNTMQFGLVSMQAMFPVTSHDEMRGAPGSNAIASADNEAQVWEKLTKRLLAIDEYRDLFRSAYPGIRLQDITFAHAANAIAAFQIDAYASSNSPWQRFLQGEQRAMSRRQMRGALSFFHAGCADCHSGPLFSDFKLHNTGLAQLGPGKGQGEEGDDDWGRMNVTGKEVDKYRFRTAPLINVQFTGPYGHAGQFASLHRYVAHYKRPERALMSYDPTREITPFEAELWFLTLDNQEKIVRNIDPKVLALRSFRACDIVSFLRAISDPSARRLCHEIPDEVPSGLPLDEGNFCYCQPRSKAKGKSSACD